MALLASFSRARRHEKRIGSAVSISIPAITNLVAGTPTLNTVNIPGISPNDVVVVTLQTPTNGVVVDAYVSASAVVTIRQNNVTGGTISSVAASVAQVQTFKL